MVNFYDEIEIEDFDLDPDLNIYFYPCPCGDKFQISLEELYDGEDIAQCPSCSLMIRVIYDKDNFIRKDEQPIQLSEITVNA